MRESQRRNAPVPALVPRIASGMYVVYHCDGIIGKPLQAHRSKFPEDSRGT